MQRVVLAGFMGSGKSTVGRILAKRLGWGFTDLDTCVEDRLGLAVPRIFALHGEAVFRAAEVQDLRRLLVAPHKVIALGGGAPGTPAVRELLRSAEATVVVHLHAPFSALYERCRLQALDAASTARPLLADAEATARRYGERLEFYRAVAHWQADASAPTPEAVADQILGRLATLNG